MRAPSRLMTLLLIITLLIAGPTPLSARQQTTTPEPSLEPLESILRADGTLNLQAGLNGSFDPTGWRMVAEPGQPPRFVRSHSPGQATSRAAPGSPAAPGDELWDDRFNALGVSSYVYAIAVSGNDVYVGGLFSAVGNMAANNIARWNSATGTWSTLGNGAGGYVYAIAVSGSDVYVGGLFNAASNVPNTRNIARWNSTTSTWSALGNGVGGYVYAIAVSGSDVYVGGLFNAASNVPNTLNIARWNSTTSTWSALGNGVGGYVYAIAVSGNNVYVGGLFNAASNVPNTLNIARWNTATSTWSALGNGVGGYVYAIAVSGNDVYVGGLFNAASNVPNTLNIAHWNTTTSTWSALGSGVSSYVYAIAVRGNDVYVGGLFNAASNVPNTRNIARWDTTTSTWSALGSGVSSYVYAIAVGADGIYVGGLFTAAGGKASRNFALWHGTTPNHAPVLNNSGNPSLTAINEDETSNAGALVSAVIASGAGGNPITDVDFGALEGLAITAVNNSAGAWQFSTNGGSTWTAFGSPSANSARLLAADANTRIRFVPNLNFNGKVDPGITFRAWDQTSGSNGGIANTTTNGGETAFSTATETASITVNPVNDAPSFSKGPDQTVNVNAGAQTVTNWATNILAGPANESGQALTFMVTNNNPSLFASQPAVAPNGTLTYRPAAGATGSASVTVTLKDNGGTANGGIDTSPPQTFTITVSVIAGNKAPVLDSSGDPFLAGIDEDPISNPGTLVSDIIASVSPLDMITDADPGALEGLAITGVDDDDGVWQYSTNGGSTWTALGNPSNSAARLLASDGSTRIRFIPNPNFNGTVDSGITFRAWDQSSGSNGGTADTTSNGGGTAFSTATETASIAVNPVNDAPDAVDDTATTPVDTPRTIIVLANDTDVENDPLTVTAVGTPANGTAIINLDQTVTYTPNSGFSGTDVFSYTAGDPGGLTDTATVTVTVGAVNNAPNAEDDTATTLTDTPVTIAVLNNDSDPDGDTLTVSAVGAPANGTASINGPAIVYTPGPSFTGVDSFTYTISDGGLTDTATVTVNVGAPGPLLWEEDLFDGLTLGPLHGQNGWAKARADRASAVVVTEGSGQVLLIDAGPGATIVMDKDVPDQTSGLHVFSVRVKVTGPADPAQPSLAKIEVRTNPGGGWDKKFQLYFGAHMRVNYSPSGAATIIVPSTTLNRWYNIRGELDLDQERLDVWVDGNLVASGIPMHPGPITDLGLSGWDRPGAVWLDNIIGMKIDASGDGKTPGGLACNLEPIFWTGPDGGRWNDPDNWSTNTVPNYQHHAFINSGPVVVDTLFGNGAGCITLSEATIWIQGSDSDSGRLFANNGIINNGTIRLERDVGSEAPGSSGLVIDSAQGQIINNGIINVNDGGESSHLISGNLINQGVVNVNYDVDFIRVFTNTTAIHIAAGQTMRFFNLGQALNQNAGVVDGEGILEISGGAILNYNGGTFNGIEPLVASSRLNIAASATAAASFNVTGASDLSGQVHPGQTVRVRATSNTGQPTLTILNDLSNAGTIRLESEGGAFQSSLLTLDGRLTNLGFIEAIEGSGGDRLIWGRITNQGVLVVNYDLRFSGFLNSVLHPFVNLGVVVIAQDKKMIVNSSGQTFNQDGGEITGAGMLEVSNTAIMNFNGGTVTGSPVFLSNSTLNIAPSAAGAASFTMAGGRLQGDVHPAQTVWVRGSASLNTVTLPNGLTNAGLIRLESEGGNVPSNLTIQSGTLVNTGNIRVNQGSNANAGIIRTILGNVVNQGTIDISLPSTQTLRVAGTGTQFQNAAGGLIRGTGRIDVSSTAFSNAGKVNPGAPLGALSITGNFPQTSTGALTIQIGGSTPGSGFDQLQVTGQAALNGALNVCLVNGFAPAVGDRFEILSFGSRTGNFALITGLEIGNGKRFEATYSSGGLTLEVVAKTQFPHNIFLPIIAKGSLSASPPGPCT